MQEFDELGKLKGMKEHSCFHLEPMLYVAPVVTSVRN